MDIVIAGTAAKALLKVQAATLDRICERIGALAEGERANVRAIKGRPGVYRLRVGDYRVIFAPEAGAVRVIDVRHRREAYR